MEPLRVMVLEARDVIVLPSYTCHPVITPLAVVALAETVTGEERVAPFIGEICVTVTVPLEDVPVPPEEELPDEEEPPEDEEELPDDPTVTVTV
jgi:hypothetical protein